MKLNQLRYACEVARNGLKVSDAAKVLHTSQPGVSRQILMLEQELGVPIFERSGKRLVGVTEPGRKILEMAESVLREADNIKRLGRELVEEDTGTLVIATTHTQARYALPGTIKAFRKRYPKVALRIRQGNPTQITEMVAEGTADMAIATEAVALSEGLVALPCYQWNRSVVAPPEHPIFENEGPLSLADVARYPIVTYDFAFAGRSLVNKTFEEAGITPEITLTAIDSDIIKAYVELGLGIGLLAAMAYDPECDLNLRAIPVDHLFRPSTTWVGIRPGSYLRAFVYELIELFAPHLTRDVVEAALGAPKGAHGFSE